MKLRSSSEASRKYIYTKDYFHNIDSDDKAYWLGFIYADGCILTNKYYSQKILSISLSVEDISHLEKFKRDIATNTPIHIYHASKGSYSNNDYCRIQLTGKEIYNDLLAKGVYENKTLILRRPTIDKQWHGAFIRGYLDGDGCIYSIKTITSRSYSVKIVGTIDVLTFIKEFIEENTSIKINKFYKRRITDEVMDLEIGGNYQVKQFLDLMYKDATVYLDRKYQRYMDLTAMLNCRVASKGAT